MATNFEMLTVAGTAVGLSAGTIDDQPNYAFITVETAQIRFRIDGTAPTSTVGHIADPGDIIEIWDDELFKFQAIRTGGASATLQVSAGRRFYGAT